MGDKVYVSDACMLFATFPKCFSNIILVPKEIRKLIPSHVCVTPYVIWAFFFVYVAWIIYGIDCYCYMVKQIGPNVSISANARIGAGVRLISCIILDSVEIMVCNRIHCFQIAIKTLTEIPLNLTHDWFALSRLMTHLFCFQENAVVFHAIVGWKSSIGKWSRVQASLPYGYLDSKLYSTLTPESR